MKYLLILGLAFKLNAQPTVSFTFDDGVTRDRPGYTFETWNRMILGHLNDAGITAIFFVKGENKEDEKGRYLLETWDKAGHRLANHTFTHPSYNNDKISFNTFSDEFLKTDEIINKYKNHIKLFRFPYLKEGGTQDKVLKFRQFLKSHHYNNGHVTIDASDWYIDSRLMKKLKKDPKASLVGYKEFYLEHIFERAIYYEKLSYELTNRHISHTLLLHHNLTSALFLGDLTKMFKQKGWKVVSADKAFNDPIFSQQPNYAGESLIWALAKDSGKYDGMLRYPAEDSRYEKEKMDDLGL